MADLRFAVLVTSSSRYVNLVFGLLVTMVLSRLLTPSEVGTILIGTNLALFVAVLRDFCSPLYLVQKAELRDEDISALALAQIVLTVVICLMLEGIAHVAAEYFHHPMMQDFLRIVALALMAEALTLPGQAVLQRQMRFGAMGIIVLAQIIVQGIISIALAASGFGILSLAWGWVGGALAGLVAAFILLPPRWLARPSLSGLADAFAFGRYQGLSSALHRAHMAATSATIGRSLSLADAGYYGRATNLSQLSERLFVDVVVAIAIPSFSSHVRSSGETLSRPYLKWLDVIATIHWPGLALMILLAEPIVAILYGSQWLAVVPIIQIIAAATFFATPTYLAWPALIATGGLRDQLIANVITLPLTLAVFIGAAQFGLYAAACSFVVTIPFKTLIELHFVRRRIPIEWTELFGALRIPLAATVATSACCGSVLLLFDDDASTSATVAFVAATAGLCGWMIAILVTRHLLWDELRDAAKSLVARLKRANDRGRTIPDRSVSASSDHRNPAETLRTLLP